MNGKYLSTGYLHLVHCRHTIIILYECMQQCVGLLLCAVSMFNVPLSCFSPIIYRCCSKSVYTYTSNENNVKFKYYTSFG